LFYVPLESYKERYTMQWSAPKTGWLERNWRRHGVEYVRIDGLVPPPPREIKAGVVLDAVGRCLNTFEQIKELLLLAESGKIKDSDVIYFDDFWTPGFEALPYAFDVLGIRPRMYSFLHAQSVDEFDFTYPMRDWMRPIERGMAAALDGIFVCCPTLKDLVVQGGICDQSKVIVTGHPFCSEEVMERMPGWYRAWMVSPEGVDPAVVPRRENKVVWSSRFDHEKNPHFFMDVAMKIIARTADVKFVVCTSAKELRSNRPTNVNRAREMAGYFPNRFVIKENLTKEEYYAELCSAKVQFNCANQDFVAITLLEASVAGCFPLYPYFRSFPETFMYNPAFMYRHLDLDDAVGKILSIVSRDDLWSAEFIKGRSWIHSRFDTSWFRQVYTMGLSWNPSGDASLVYDATRIPLFPHPRHR
jgi:glycosyltransferase involved in cell wall biosynthesis